MAFEVKIIADSISPCGQRLTTITATYPRFIHSELMTHRCFARNAASSRAMPWEKTRQKLLDDPVVPIVFGSEQKGMQTGGEIECPRTAKICWTQGRDSALVHADFLHDLGVHKSIVNRMVEPYSWITTLITATEWSNFFRLRCHPDAEIHFRKIAGMIRDAINESEPKPKHANQWHLPFIEYEDTLAAYDLAEDRLESYLEILRNVSVARCARVSYLTHEGKRDLVKDLELFDKLCNGSGYGHWSPHEHVAQATDDATFRSGPFLGWKQYRKLFPNENG